MSDNEILYCLIAIILGYVLCKQMVIDGFSVGGVEASSPVCTRVQTAVLNKCRDDCGNCDQKNTDIVLDNCTIGGVQQSYDTVCGAGAVQNFLAHVPQAKADALKGFLASAETQAQYSRMFPHAPTPSPMHLVELKNQPDSTMFV